MLIQKTNNMDFPNLIEYIINVGKLKLSFLPEANMIINSIKFQGKETLGQRGGIKDYINKLSNFGFPLISPWMGRLHDNEYVFEGKKYIMKNGDLKLDPNGLPIHGLLTASRDWKYNIAEIPHGVEVLASYNYDKKVKGFSSFPFKHSLSLKYIITKDSLTIITGLINNDDIIIPVAFGYHPLFKDAEIKTIEGIQSEIFLDSNCLPVKEFNPNNYDSTAKMFNMQETWKARLRLGLSTEIEMKVEGFPYMLIWTPPYSDFIAIEPMTSNIDPFLNGGTLLNPGESKRTAIELKFV